jgi:hypothetical protein
MSKTLNKPLMPTATAVWLIDNTSLTFEQIADFCGLHKLEIEGIANEDVAHGIKGFDPIASGQLTLEKIDLCQKDSTLRLVLDESALDTAEEINSSHQTKKRKQPRYTPVSRRRDRPDAIAWIIRNHPEISDGQISRLIGTTKSTINTVRNRTHWNAASIKPVDPVSLGLCPQKALDEIVDTAGRRKERREKEKLRAQRRADRKEQEERNARQNAEPETEIETSSSMENDDNNLEENG